MTTTVYLIRHAEAEGNLYRRIQGQYDSRITELGMKQILALRERFAHTQVAGVYSSDLTRAKTTAQAISTPRNLPIQTDPRLREVHMGHWEDKTWAQVQKEDGAELMAFAKDPVKWTIGESLATQIERVREAILHIAKKHPGETVCIISHGNVIRTLLSSVYALPSERFSEISHCDNTGVSLLEVTGNDISLSYANDASHLDEQTSTFARQNWWRKKSGFDESNIDFTPLHLATQREEYLEARRMAWEEIYGNLEGFSDVYLATAKEHVTLHPKALMAATAGDQTVGYIELSPHRGALNKEGAISFFYLKPQFRGMGFGPQLIGHAVSVYRKLGREKITLFVSKANLQAKSFYERFGFTVCGEEMGVQDMLWKMEMDIRVIIREI